MHGILGLWPYATLFWNVLILYGRPAQPFYWYGHIDGRKLIAGHIYDKKFLRATCIFTEIKLQKIEGFLRKTGVHFSQYPRNLFPKVGEEQQKKGLRLKSELISASIPGI